jgi:hypothetical protein
MWNVYTQKTGKISRAWMSRVGRAEIFSRGSGYCYQPSSLWKFRDFFLYLIPPSPFQK